MKLIISAIFVFTLLISSPIPAANAVATPTLNVAYEDLEKLSKLVTSDSKIVLLEFSPERRKAEGIDRHGDRFETTVVLTQLIQNGSADGKSRLEICGRFHVIEEIPRATLSDNRVSYNIGVDEAWGRDPNYTRLYPLLPVDDTPVQKYLAVGSANAGFMDFTYLLIKNDDRGMLTAARKLLSRPVDKIDAAEARSLLKKNDLYAIYIGLISLNAREAISLDDLIVASQNCDAKDVASIGDVLARHLQLFKNIRVNDENAAIEFIESQDQNAQKAILAPMADLVGGPNGKDALLSLRKKLDPHLRTLISSRGGMSDWHDVVEIYKRLLVSVE